MYNQTQVIKRQSSPHKLNFSYHRQKMWPPSNYLVKLRQITSFIFFPHKGISRTSSTRNGAWKGTPRNNERCKQNQQSSFKLSPHSLLKLVYHTGKVKECLAMHPISQMFSKLSTSKHQFIGLPLLRFTRSQGTASSAGWSRRRGRRLCAFWRRSPLPIRQLVPGFPHQLDRRGTALHHHLHHQHLENNFIGENSTRWQKIAVIVDELHRRTSA